MEYHDHDPVQMEEEISSRGFLFCFQVSPDQTSSRTLVEERKEKKKKKQVTLQTTREKTLEFTLSGVDQQTSRPANQHNVPMRSIVFAWGKGGTRYLTLWIMPRCLKTLSLHAPQWPMKTDIYFVQK